MSIPEIDLTLQPGTLGGRFTTLEGILDEIYEQLNDKVFASEDSTDDNSALRVFLNRLQAVGRLLGCLNR